MIRKHKTAIMKAICLAEEICLNNPERAGHCVECACFHLWENGQGHCSLTDIFLELFQKEERKEEKNDR